MSSTFLKYKDHDLCELLYCLGKFVTIKIGALHSSERFERLVNIVRTQNTSEATYDDCFFDFQTLTG